MRRKLRTAIAAAAALGVVSAGGLTGCATGTDSLPSRSTVVWQSIRAAEYYRPTLTRPQPLPKNGWSWSTFAQGIQALYWTTGVRPYWVTNLDWGQGNGWKLYSGPKEYDPDTLKAAQTYFDLAKFDRSVSLTAADATMARDLASQPLSRYDWIDALFMGLPTWTRWAARTGNPAYLSKMDALYRWMRDSGATSARCTGAAKPQRGLYDATAGLWYRDCRYVGALDAHGQKIFWARGNGWVMAALAQVLQTLPPNDPRRPGYAGMLKTMAAAVAKLQRADGFWRASLLDPALYPQPESSGTALMTYALAYGIKSGLLPAKTYLPVVARAWNGLTTVSLQPSGFLTDCQPAGIEPAAPYTAPNPRVAASGSSAGTVNSDSQPFCVGAFLLAGSQVATLAPNK